MSLKKSKNRYPLKNSGVKTCGKDYSGKKYQGKIILVWVKFREKPFLPDTVTKNQWVLVNNINSATSHPICLAKNSRILR